MHRLLCFPTHVLSASALMHGESKMPTSLLYYVLAASSVPLASAYTWMAIGDWGASYGELAMGDTILCV